MPDEVEVYLSETRCPVCGDDGYYLVRYIPNKPDCYRLCANCNAVLGDEVVTEE